MSRISYYLKNLKFAFLGYIIGIIFSFISRFVFIRTLSIEYLGLTGLFSNIIMFLSLAELGFGQAIIFSLYKPLAIKDLKTVSSLMNLYKKIYRIIGFTVILLGISLTPFLNYFLKETPNIPNIKGIFLLFVINSAISYFYSYKRSLIIADQKSYIDSKYHNIFYTTITILQIVVLLIFKNYILFLLLLIIGTFIENLFISRIVDKIYPFIKLHKQVDLEKKDKLAIINNIKAMVFHKIGQIVLNGTNSIILSKFIGIAVVGCYSNYLLILKNLNSFIGLLFQSVTASVGNLSITEDLNKSKFIFSCIFLVNYWIYASLTVFLIIMINPIIKTWLGEEYLFSKAVIFLLLFDFYISGMRKAVLTFRNAYGLYWQDRYKPIFECSINIVVSLYFVVKVGTAGVFIGSIMSNLLTCFWVEPYILFKHAFKMTILKYLYNYVLGLFFVYIIFLITNYLSAFICQNSFIFLIVKGSIAFIIPNLLLILLLYRTDEYKFLLDIFKKRLFSKGYKLL